MVSARLEVRLSSEYREKLDEIVRCRAMPVAALMREMIDRLYEDNRREERLAAVRRIGELNIEDMPDPDELSRQMDAYESLSDVRRR